MRVLLSLVIVLSIVCGVHCSAVPQQLEESFENVDEEVFEEIFNLPPVEDPEELKRRNEALEINEEEIKEVNKEYEAGNKTWYDALNEFSDLPEDEFLSAMTGDINFDSYGRGLLDPSPESSYDEESEKYFDQFRFSRSSIPAFYDSRALGNVSPVKNQMQCGSCVAFSSMGAVETCFKKLTGTFGDYSEQQFVDCGFGKNAFGCDGAATHAYLNWASVSKAGLSHESQYPYLNKEPKLTCPSNLPVYNQGATITGSSYTYQGSEDLLKQMVYEHGAAVSSVVTAGDFKDYKGGVYAGCTDPNAKTDHAILVVGYGTENEDDYWLIKNSWSTRWGDQGFMKLKRGVGMCGIGGNVVTVSCDSVSGPTDAPMTTEKPCIDVYSNCADLAKTSCYKSSTAESCAKSCGLCPGMTPAESVTCYDKYTNCADMAVTSCYQSNISGSCAKSCGLCPGMTPAASYTCYDQYSNCPQLTAYCSQDNIKAGCKKSCKTC
jgi:C1A family cysteine protease